MLPPQGRLQGEGVATVIVTEETAGTDDVFFVSEQETVFPSFEPAHDHVHHEGSVPELFVLLPDEQL